jgi:hypothetical protein
MANGVAVTVEFDLVVAFLVMAQQRASLADSYNKSCRDSLVALILDRLYKILTRRNWASISLRSKS